MTHDLRAWMSLISKANLMEGVEGNPQVPAQLYHGTSTSAWKAMQAENMMRAGEDGDGYISFTTDWNTALKFAHWAHLRDDNNYGDDDDADDMNDDPDDETDDETDDGEEVEASNDDSDGVVLTFDGNKLKAAYRLEPFQDHSLMAYEYEWRISENGIQPAFVENVKNYIIDVSDI